MEQPCCSTQPDCETLKIQKLVNSWIEFDVTGVNKPLDLSIYSPVTVEELSPLPKLIHQSKKRRKTTRARI